MTKPIQAQIEAAEAAVWEEFGYTITRHRANIVAKAALTAAAEVGEKGLASLPPEEQRKAHEWMDRKLIAATIEHCARVAHERLAAGDNFTKVVAAIRALKDKP